MVCHSRAANFVLGLTTLQMNKVHDYGGVKDNQLRTLEHLGVFRVSWRDHLVEGRRQANLLAEPFGALGRLLPEGARPRLPPRARAPVDWLERRLGARPRFTTRLPRLPEGYGRLVDPYDRRQLLEARARSYLHANCAQCHVEAGGGNAQVDLEFTTRRGRMKAIGVRPLHDAFGVKEARIVAPGEPGRSTLYLRVARRGPGQMPPLATSEVDAEAVKLLRAWIEGMRGR
jgi:hypothetical protein